MTTLMGVMRKNVRYKEKNDWKKKMIERKIY
jgi:hypothetical protein